MSRVLALVLSLVAAPPLVAAGDPFDPKAYIESEVRRDSAQVQAGDPWTDLAVLKIDAQGLPPIAFPTIPMGEELPLFRQATGHCVSVLSRRSGAGENLQGETGFLHIAECGSGAEGPGMAIEIGWS